jgi:hypothetical protein
MIMKKLKSVLCVTAALFLLTFIPTQLISGTAPDPTDPDEKALAGTIESAEISALLSRLDDIKEMDKSSLSSSQKQELRKEVREIKSVLKADRGGIYLSGAALVLVIVLLILLL